MPTLIQGFGTFYCGERDYRADGSYVTTEWIVFALVPLVPLKSLRVSENVGIGRTLEDQRESKPPFYQKQTYLIIERTGLNVSQVLRVYAFVLLLGGWASCGVWLLLHFRPGRYAIWVFALSFIFPWAIPVVLRRRARSRLGQRVSRFD